MINTTYITYYKDTFEWLINAVLVPVLIALAFIVFLWGAYKYFIKGAADPKAQETGRTFTIYGVVGFVIIFSLWGLVNVLMSTLNLGGETAPDPPKIGGGTAPSGSGSFPAPGYSSFGDWSDGDSTPGYTDFGEWNNGSGNSEYQNCLADGTDPAICAAATDQSNSSSNNYNYGSGAGYECDVGGPGASCITLSGSRGICDASGACVRGIAGSPCDVPSDCILPLTCSPASKTCVTSSNSNASSGNGALGGYDASCTRDDQCISGVCDFDYTCGIAR